MRHPLLSALAILALAAGGEANAQYLVPDSSTAPFEDWTRLTADSTYNEWDVFTDPYNGDEPDALVDNAPDVGTYGPSGALVEQTVPGAFLTSGLNIYSYSSANDFDVSVPGYGYGAGYNTRVFAQVRTLGTFPDLSSIELTYDNGSGSVTTAPDYMAQDPIEISGGYGGYDVITWAAWDLEGYDPTTSLIEFAAESSSLSLDELVIDTYTQTSSFTALPAPALAGDMNLDGVLDANDIHELYDNLGRAGGFYDLDGDGDAADQQDVDELVSGILGTAYGDADLDGDVDGTDFSVLSGNFNAAGGWSDGDFTGDGVINGGDFSLLSGSFGFPSGAAVAVPEPATAAALALGVFATLGSTRRLSARR